MLASQVPRTHGGLSWKLHCLSEAPLLLRDVALIDPSDRYATCTHFRILATSDPSCGPFTRWSYNVICLCLCIIVDAYLIYSPHRLLNVEPQSSVIWINAPDSWYPNRLIYRPQEAHWSGVEIHRGGGQSPECLWGRVVSSLSLLCSDERRHCDRAVERCVCVFWLDEYFLLRPKTDAVYSTCSEHIKPSISFQCVKTWIPGIGFRVIQFEPLF